MIQIFKFVTLLIFVVVLSAVSVQGRHRCEGYFCEKNLSEIHIIMTHNSLSDRGIADNQKYKMDRQFRDGVRGFNLDLQQYEGSTTKLWTCHGKCFDPTEEIEDLVKEINKPENRDEFVVIQVQNGNGVDDDTCITDEQLDMFLELFGNLLVKQFADGDDGGFYQHQNLDITINDNRRVYLTTDRCENADKNFFRSRKLIGENSFEWSHCTALLESKRQEMKTSCRDGRSTGCSDGMQLMNSFCSFVFPSPRRARHANKKCRLLNNAQRFKDSGNFQFDDHSGAKKNQYPNIIMVDFYNQGDPFGAQKCLRDGKVGDKGAGCGLCDKMGDPI